MFFDNDSIEDVFELNLYRKCHTVLKHTIEEIENNQTEYRSIPLGSMSKKFGASTPRVMPIDIFADSFRKIA